MVTLQHTFPLSNIQILIPQGIIVMHSSLLILYLLVECYMCWYELHGCWLGGVTIGQSRTSVGQLIQVCFIKLVHWQGLSPNVQPRTEWDGVAILVGEGLANVEPGFLEKQQQMYVEYW